MTALESVLTSRNASLPDMVALLRRGERSKVREAALIGRSVSAVACD